VKAHERAMDNGSIKRVRVKAHTVTRGSSSKSRKPSQPQRKLFGWF
jgi:hypothetical protein